MGLRIAIRRSSARDWAACFATRPDALADRRTANTSTSTAPTTALFPPATSASRRGSSRPGRPWRRIPQRARARYSRQAGCRRSGHRPPGRLGYWPGRSTGAIATDVARLFGFTADNRTPIPTALAAVNESIVSIHLGTFGVSKLPDLLNGNASSHRHSGRSAKSVRMHSASAPARHPKGRRLARRGSSAAAHIRATRGGIQVVTNAARFPSSAPMRRDLVRADLNRLDSHIVEAVEPVDSG